MLPLALMGLRIPSLLSAACTHCGPTRSPAHAASSAGRRGMACAGDPGQPLADPALAARESPGSGPPGKLSTLLPVVDLAIDKMIQNLARRKESFIIGYSC